MTKSIQASYGPATADRIRRNLPADLLLGLTANQIARVEQLVNATYLDGYVAGGGDTTDTVTHHDAHRRRLCLGAIAAVDQAATAGGPSVRVGKRASAAILRSQGVIRV